MILTEEILEAGKSRNGGWSANQFKCLGLKWKKVKKGWKLKVIGKHFADEKIERFLALKDVHILVKEIFKGDKKDKFTK